MSVQFEDQQAPASQNRFKLDYYELINHNDYQIITMLMAIASMIQIKKPKANVKLRKAEGKPERAKISKTAGKRRVARTKSATKTVRKQGPVQSVGPRRGKRKKN